MKRTQGVFFGIAVLLLTAMFIVAGCDTGSTSPVAVTGVSLNNSTVDLYMKTKVVLTAAVVPPDATNKAVTWSTSDSTVATVAADGTVTPVAGATANDTAVITVTTVDGGKTAACTVTVKAPVDISNSAGLTAIAADPESMNKSYRLTADITGVTAPIGLVSGDTPIPFTGDFDGDGHTITLGITSGLTISQDFYTGTLAGLFAAVGDIAGNPGGRGKVYNLKVAGSIGISGADNVCAGGVVGVMMPGAEVRSVASSVAVTVSGSGDANAGGIVGVSMGTVSNVYTTGNVSATTSGTASAYAGGIAGVALGTVSYAYATGAVSAEGTGTGNGTDNEPTVAAGGIAGAATGAVVQYTVALNSSVAVNNSTSYNTCSFRIASTSGGKVIINGAANYGDSNLDPSGGTHKDDEGADEQDGVDVNVTAGTPYTAPDQDWWTGTGFSGADWTTVWEWDTNTGLPGLR